MSSEKGHINADKVLPRGSNFSQLIFNGRIDSCDVCCVMLTEYRLSGTQ